MVHSVFLYFTYYYQCYCGPIYYGPPKQIIPVFLLERVIIQHLPHSPADFNPAFPLFLTLLSTIGVDAAVFGIILYTISTSRL